MEPAADDFERALENVKSGKIHEGPRMRLEDVQLFRERMKMTQQEFADHLNVPLATIKDWEAEGAALNAKAAQQS